MGALFLAFIIIFTVLAFVHCILMERLNDNLQELISALNPQTEAEKPNEEPPNGKARK